MRSFGLGTGLGEAAGAHWPLYGVVRRDAVNCYCNGRWETLTPDRYQVIDIGVDEHVEARRQRNRRFADVSKRSFLDEQIDSDYPKARRENKKTLPNVRGRR